jgi:geranylgeranyl pyrophosphate synthase
MNAKRPAGERDAGVPPAALTATRRLLRARLATVATVGYRAALRQALQRPGRLLGGATPLWVSLPLACAVAAGSDGTPAAPVAAATELMAAALELLDDLEDGDLPAGDPLLALGLPRLINVGTGLLTLAMGTLAGEAAQVLTAAVMAATAGQDADLAGEGAGLDEAACWRILEAKSANLAAAVARLGALAGGAAPDIADGYARFARHLGRFGQLANDLSAAAPGGAHSDLRRRKPTVLLAAAGLTGTPPDDDPTAPPGALVERLYTSGAVAYVWLLAEAERQRALAQLARLERRDQTTAALAHLVGSSLPAPPA